MRSMRGIRRAQLRARLPARCGLACGTEEILRPRTGWISTAWQRASGTAADSILASSEPRITGRKLAGISLPQSDFRTNEWKPPETPPHGDNLRTQGGHALQLSGS